MDNVQDTATAPQGQAETVEQAPDVQSVNPTPTDSTAEATAEPSQPSDETSYEQVAASKGFKSPDELAKAYVNSERLATKASMKAADLEKQFFPERKQDAPEPQHQFRPQAQDEQQALQELDKFVNERIARERETLRSEVKTELAKVELRSVIRDNADFGKYATDIKELKSKYPDMSFQEAYTFSKALKGDSIQEAKAEGRREGTWAAQKQSSAQVAQTKPVTEDKVPVGELIQGSSKRLTIKQGMTVDQVKQIQAERQFIENQLMARAEDEKDFLAFRRN